MKRLFPNAPPSVTPSAGDTCGYTCKHFLPNPQSIMGRLSRDKRDIYYRLAKQKGYRARSAFKLLQIDAEFNVLSNIDRVVDLCAAPGSWSQVLAERMLYNEKGEAIRDEKTIVAVDLQPMAPIDGVITLQGDITSTETARQIIQHFQGSKAQLIICDGAPDVTGLHDVDEYLQHQLLSAALDIGTRILEKGGTFLAKVFRGPNINYLTARMRLLFDHVCITKPASSRPSSMEAFCICRNYNGQQLQADVENTALVHAPFVACGDLNTWDSETSYPLNGDEEYVPPVAPPLDPPYVR